MTARAPKLTRELERETPWQRYERLKKWWKRQNPGATSEQYSEAMKRIAEECGV